MRACLHDERERKRKIEKERERESLRRGGEGRRARKREREKEERNSRERRRNAKSDGEVGESFAKHGAYARVPSKQVSLAGGFTRSAVST